MSKSPDSPVVTNSDVVVSKAPLHDAFLELEKQLPLKERPFRMNGLVDFKGLCREFSPSERALLLEAKDFFAAESLFVQFRDFITTEQSLIWQTTYGLYFSQTYLGPLLSFPLCTDNTIKKLLQITPDMVYPTLSGRVHFFQKTDLANSTTTRCKFCNKDKRTIFDCSLQKNFKTTVCIACKNKLAAAESLLMYLTRAREAYRQDIKTLDIYWEKIRRVFPKVAQCLCPNKIDV